MSSAKPKRKAGRPTTLTPKVEEKLHKLVSQGKTFREACRALKIDFHAVIARRFDDDAFHRRSVRATCLGTEANLELAETRLKRSTNQRISVDRELAHHYRWKASKLLSAYKDKVDIDLRVEEREISDEAIAHRFLFAISEEARRAPLDKFITAQASTLRLVAEQIAIRGGGSTDPRFYEGKYGRLAQAIIEISEIVKAQLNAGETQPAVKALPAPAEPLQRPETGAGAAAPVSPLSRARDPDVEVIE